MSPWALENAALRKARDEMDRVKREERKAEQQHEARRQMLDWLGISTLRVAHHKDASVKAVVITSIQTASEPVEAVVIAGPGWSHRMAVIDAIRLADGIRAVLS